MILEMNCLTSNTKWPEFIEQNFSGVREPFSAGIELLPDCNFKCIHCYAESDRKKSKRVMTTSEILQVIDILEKHNCIDLFFTGGEALLHKDFCDIYRYAKKKGIMVSVLTNASLISEKHINLWLEYPPELVSVTMYGADEATYNAVTQNPYGYSMFVNGVKLLKDNGIPFEIKCIGMRQNYNDIHQIREFAKSMGINNSILAWDIRPMNDGSKEPISCRVSPLQAFMIEITDPERKKFWDRVALNPDRKQPTLRQKEGYLYPCAIAEQFVFITHDGYMQGCVKAINPRYNLLEGDFQTGWEYLGKEAVMKKASLKFPCRNCDKFRYCGQCTAAFVDENNDPERPVEFYCEYGELLKMYMDQVEQATKK